MLEETRKFYERMKLPHVVGEPLDDSEAPIAFSHVFHKEYPRLPSIPLKQIYEEGELERLMEERGSTREFSEEPLSFFELSKILSSCRIIDSERDPEKRTYPSGGARFPVELYVVSFNVEGLHGGAYHYNIKRESLERLWEKDLTKEEDQVVSPYLENTAAALVFTSAITRSEIKYGYNAYPYSLIEAGHMAQNIQLTSAKIGVGACSIGGFVDDMIINTFDLTEDEIPIYVVGLGKIKEE